MDEAIQLRDNGINVPIQILSRTDASRADEVINNGLIQTVSDLKLASALSRAACKGNRKSTIHVKLDTGMGRLGMPCGKEALKKIEQIAAMPGLDLEGIMTHFASADEVDPKYTLMQFELFMEQCYRLEKMGVYIPIRHVANSAAIINYPQMHLNMVRPGIALYGLYTGDVKRDDAIQLKPAMALKARIISIRQMDQGASISYGRTFKTGRKSLIATISCGYADGFPRGLSNQSLAVIGGELAPIIGTICMDHCMADITNIGRDVIIGEEVTLFGSEKFIEISIEKIAKNLGTITYDLVCGIGMRVSRVYFKQGEIESVYNHFHNIKDC